MLLLPYRLDLLGGRQRKGQSDPAALGFRETDFYISYCTERTLRREN